MADYPRVRFFSSFRRKPESIDGLRSPAWTPDQVRGDEGGAALMAGQTLVIIGGREFELRGLGRVVGLDPAREAGALHRFRAEIIERLDAELPREIVEQEQVPFLDTGGVEEVMRRGPTGLWRGNSKATGWGRVC